MQVGGGGSNPTKCILFFVFFIYLFIYLFVICFFNYLFLFDDVVDIGSQDGVRERSPFRRDGEGGH